MRRGASSRPGGSKRYYPHRRRRAHFARTDKTSETAVRREAAQTISDQAEESHGRVFSFDTSKQASEFSRLAYGRGFKFVTRFGRFVEVVDLSSDDVVVLENEASLLRGDVVAKLANFT